MTNRDFEILYQKVCHQILNQELGLAFQQLQHMQDECSRPVCLEQLQATRTTYQYLLEYEIAGISDPEQGKIYERTQVALLEIADELRNEYFTKNANNIAYLEKRLHPNLQTIDTTNYNSSIHFNNCFQYLWLKEKYQQEDVRWITDIFLEESILQADKCAFVTAIMLGLLRTFDETKFHVLLDLYLQQEKEIQQRALVGLLFCMHTHHTRIPLYKQLFNRIQLSMEDEETFRLSKEILFQIILSSQTEKITKKMNEVFPSMIKSKLKANPNINLEELMNDSFSMTDMNPEWKSFLSDSSFNEKIMELSNLQSEGGDLFMSTFSALKNYSFFNSIANWFLPFTNHPLALQNSNAESFLSAQKMVEKSIFLCNSDKYSLCFSIMQVPSHFQEMMQQTFQMEKDQMEELKNAEYLTAPDTEKNLLSKMYIQDLFRFYNLNDKKSDFLNPFKNLKEIHKHLFLEGNVHFHELEKALSEYYIKREMYNEAISILQEIEQRDPADIETIQKCGFCHQNNKDYKSALEYYHKAEVIHPNTLWNLQRIAFCEKCLGNLDASLSYYQQCAELEPSNTNDQNIGYCLIGLERYAEALKVFYKLDYNLPDTPKIERAIGWCSFAEGKLEESERYYQKIADDQKDVNDWTNYGHVQLSMRKTPQAVRCYKHALEKMEGDVQKFIESFTNDEKHLIKNGVSEKSLHLFKDYLVLQLIQ